ncbi:MAG: sensor histidine kinase [Acutalibacteraceae bacterium]
MKRTKTMSLLAFGIIIFYIINIGNSFIYSKNIIVRSFRERNYFLRDVLCDDIAKMENEEEIISYIRTFYTSDLSVVALFDSEHNFLAKAENCIEITYDETGDKRLISIEEYITDDIRSELSKTMIYGDSSIKSLSLAEKDGETVPVEITLTKTFINNEPQKVCFSAEKPTEILTSDEIKRNPLMKLWFHNLCSHDYEFKTIDMLGGYFNSFCESEGTWDTILDENTITGVDFIYPANGKECILFYACEFDIFNTVIRSPDFTSTVLGLSIIFFILFTATEIIVFLIYSKSRKLTQAREAFIAGAAHELKTPLAVITNQCECILENVAPEKNGEYINSIYSEAKKTNRMIMSLIQFNKLSSGERINREKVNINDIALKEAEKYRSLIESKNIKLCEEYADNAVINADKKLIALALDNYISNAVKFTPEGGTVEIKTQKHKNKVKFSVYNSGSHIADEDKSHIWEELYRGDKARERQGSTGMGLAINRKIFELHSFRYGFENTKDGVKFYFTQ